ncbi:MAG: DDE-type integrase/transposase/recombinase, partial [Alicyclobacillus sp.]|nr:DDE-type integrase/transposase/recombinase [Alicyclobacillus sp.]
KSGSHPTKADLQCASHPADNEADKLKHRGYEAMEDDRRQQIAQFRYEVIAPLLHGPEKGSLQAALETAAQRTYRFPDGTERRLSVRTLERYLSLYRRGGFEALYPAPRSDRSRPRALPQAVIERAIALRKEQPARTVEQIIAMLEMEGLAAPGFVRRSTLAAHLRKAGVPRVKAVRKSARTWQRYTANEVHEIWQCDVYDSLRVPDADSGGQMRVARLVAVLDDKSRYICYAAFYFRENLPVIEDALKKAIAAHGTPKVFYCDNAKVYQSGQLTQIAAHLGFEIRHSKPYSPQGRGYGKLAVMENHDRQGRRTQRFGVDQLCIINQSTNKHLSAECRLEGVVWRQSN